MSTNPSTTTETAKADALQASAKPKIYCAISGRWNDGDVVVVAIAEDGHCLAQHMSSSESWAWHDIGLVSDWKHEHYRAHYPNGYELEWVDDVRAHAGMMAAYQKNQELGKAPEPAPTPDLRADDLDAAAEKGGAE